MTANSSYLFGDDVTGGWGHRYFYTFYSEFGDRSGASEAEVAVLSLTFLLSVVLNVTIACAVLRYREMRTVTNCFLLNLAAADLVFALGIPVVAVTRITQEWVLGDLVCRILPYSQFVCGFVLLWTLTLISMDRHRCIVVPPYRSQLTPRLAAALTLGTWLLAAVLFLPVAFWFRQQRSDNRKTICTLVFPKSDSVNLSLCFTIPVLLLACLLPMSLLVFHYHRIFQKLLKTRNRWSSNAVVSSLPDLQDPGSRRQSSLSVIGNLSPWTRKASNSSVTVLGLGTKGRANSVSQHEELRLAKHIRVVRVLLLNVVAVLLMWLPITILMFLIYVDGSRPNEDTDFFLRSHHFIWALLVALFNTIVNPLLYGVLSENFRSCFAKLWFGSRRKRKCNDFYADPVKSTPSRSNNEPCREENHSSVRDKMKTLLGAMAAVVVVAAVVLLQSGSVSANLTAYSLEKLKTASSTNMDKRAKQCGQQEKPQVLLLLDFLADNYLHNCVNVILYEKELELESASSNFDLPRLLTDFPRSYINGQISKAMKSRLSMLNLTQNQCKNYLLFLGDLTEAVNIIGSQTDSKVVIVTSSTRWKIEEYLQSLPARGIVNLLVVSNVGSNQFLIKQEGESGHMNDMNLYTHDLYVDGVGSSSVRLLTSWRCGRLTRNINLFPQKMLKGFSGRQFSVVASHQPPFTFKRRLNPYEEENESQVWDGVEVKLLKMLSQYLNYSIEIKESKEELTITRGPSEVVIAEVLDGNAEIGIGGVYKTIDRMKKVSMSSPHSVDCAAFITRASTALPRYRAILGPFHWSVWLTLTITYMVAILPMSFADTHSMSYLIKHPWEIENMFWYVFGTFTNCFTFAGEKSWSKTKKNASRLLIGWYWAFTIIITACYTGSIVSYITLFVYPDVADHVEQLARANFRVGSLSIDGWGEWFKDSEHEATKYILRDMELIPNTTQGLKNVTNSYWLPMFRPYAFLAGRAQMEYIVKTNYTSERRKEMLHITKDCFVPFGVSYVFPLHAVYTQQFNNYILRAQQSGLLEKLLNEFKWEVERSSKGKLLQAGGSMSLRQALAADRKLTLDDTQGMYLLMGAGYLIGLIVLFFEMSQFTFKTRKMVSVMNRVKLLYFWKNEKLVHYSKALWHFLLSFYHFVRHDALNVQADNDYSSFKKFDSRILNSNMPDRAPTPCPRPLQVTKSFSEIHLNRISEVSFNMSMPNLRHEVHSQPTTPDWVKHVADDDSLMIGSVTSLPWEMARDPYAEDHLQPDRAHSN